MSDSDRQREFYNIPNKEKSEIGDDQTIGAFAGSKAGEYYGGAAGQMLVEKLGVILELI